MYYIQPYVVHIKVPMTEGRTRLDRYVIQNQIQISHSSAIWRKSWWCCTQNTTSRSATFHQDHMNEAPFSKESFKGPVIAPLGKSLDVMGSSGEWIKLFGFMCPCILYLWLLFLKRIKYPKKNSHIFKEQYRVP